jgi:L,D-peptidoglycan transpeptidase YkuD (ErfK/YbiS/YcfS/YnhG family)
MKYLRVFLLTILLYSSGQCDELKNNIIIRCVEQNFQCKGYFQNRIFDVNVGKNGLVFQQEKKEGDLSTPIGSFNLENIVFYKNEKPKTKFRTLKIQQNYKWCDDSKSEIYNKFFILNKKTQRACDSYEDLLRNDGVYDFVIPINYNMSDPVPYKGSAIFIHIKNAQDSGTAGCIALKKNDLIFIMKNLRKNSGIFIEKVK